MKPDPNRMNTRRTRTSLLVTLCMLAAHAAVAAQRNILLIIADDYGVDSSSIFNSTGGASLPPTPNLSALAADGVRFTNAYAHPTCSPTRASMLTGRYPFRTGIKQPVDATTAQLATNESTLPELLASSGSGYACAHVGKWHLAPGGTAPNNIGGWPHFSGSIPGGVQSYTSWARVVNGTQATQTTYATTVNVNDALSWISAQGTTKWFLWLAFNAGHTPLHKPPNDLHSYDSLSGTTQNINNNPRPYYEASIEAMDTEIGRLLAGVNLADTTVIFIGDNGTPNNVIQPPYTSGQGKDTLREGGVRVPFFISGPDVVNPDRTSSALVHVVDVFATVLELAGVNPAAAQPAALPSDSRSLVPILNNQAFTPAQDAVLVELGTTQVANAKSGRAARRGDYKLLRYDDATEEFFNVTADPTETTNLLAGTLTTAQLAAYDDLGARLDAWANMPTLQGSPIAGTTFGVDVGWFYGHAFSLWRSTDLSTWSQVTGATAQDNGSTIRLTDPTPPGDRAFYRVQNN